MPIENRNLETGTRLVARYKKQTYRAEVVQGEEGKPRYRLEDGREFKSPSAAGTAITGGACNGWAFWSVEGAESPNGGQGAPDAATGAIGSASRASTSRNARWLVNRKKTPPRQASISGRHWFSN